MCPIITSVAKNFYKNSAKPPASSMTSKSPVPDDTSSPCSSAAISGGKQCFLCEGKDRTMVLYKNIQAEVKHFITQHCDKTLSGEEWVCKRHVMEAQRYCNNEGYVPKWKGSAPMGHPLILIKGVVIQFVSI